MPKILDDMEEKILKEARHQVFTDGYEKTSIRTIAAACHIAVGTVYNYYKSKEYLIASFMVPDWIETEFAMRRRCEGADSLIEACRGIYAELLDFEARYEPIFKNPEAVRDASGIFMGRHRNLRQVEAGMLQETAERLGAAVEPYTVEFAAEAILTWSNEGVPFEQLEPILLRIVQK